MHCDRRFSGHGGLGPWMLKAGVLQGGKGEDLKNGRAVQDHFCRYRPNNCNLSLRVDVFGILQPLERAGG